jgi:hypothetical protein
MSYSVGPLTRNFRCLDNVAVPRDSTVMTARFGVFPDTPEVERREIVLGTLAETDVRGRICCRPP